MADGTFPGLVSKDTSLNATSNPIYTQLTDGTVAIGVTSNALDVNIDNASIAVTATDLDIRDLVNTQDSIEIWANTAKDGTGTDYIPIVDTDGKLIISNPGGTEYVEDAVAAATATGTTNLVERDDALAGITPAEGDWSKLYCSANGALWVAVDGEVAINDGGNTITVDGAVTVSASDLDIRDLVHTQDSVALGDGTGVLVDVLDSTVDALYTAITDGTETLNITAAGEAEIDIAAQSLTALKISKDANANTELNPIYVHNVDTIISGEEIHDYDTAAAVASSASDNHDYTVVGTFLLKSVIVSGSGNIKYEIQSGPIASLATVAVGFLTGRQGDTDQVFFDPPLEVPVTGTGTVRVIRTNRQGTATDVYSTIIGSDI